VSGIKRPFFQVYEAKDGWRWRLRAMNHRIIAESGEAYRRERDCWRAIKNVKLSVARANGQ
jgi:uncharacterized protein YegP (UPF0339 family)